MNNRTYIYVFALLLLVLVIALTVFVSQTNKTRTPLAAAAAPIASPPNQSSTPVDAAVATPTSSSSNQSSTPVDDGEPKLFKDERYPPQTPKEKAMWNWWNRMSKTDSRFEWKRPISFYGKVIDQYGEPVRDAKVTFEWTNISVSGTGKAETASDGSGLFSLSGVQGKTLGIDVYKSGYLVWQKQSRQGFDYAAFFQADFYAANSNHPVIFKLWKINPNAEPLIWRADSHELENNKTRYLNLKTGEMVYSTNPTGDLAIQVASSAQTPGGKFNYTVTISAPNGGSMVESTDDFMVKPPDAGYQSSFEVSQDGDAPVFNRSISKRFYLKTWDGKYAAVDLSCGVDANGGRAQISYYYNPSGSKNLEYDPTKQVNK